MVRIIVSLLTYQKLDSNCGESPKNHFKSKTNRISPEYQKKSEKTRKIILDEKKKKTILDKEKLFSFDKV